MGTVATARLADLADLLQQYLRADDPLRLSRTTAVNPALRDSTLVGYLQQEHRRGVASTRPALPGRGLQDQPFARSGPTGR